MDGTKFNIVFLNCLNFVRTVLMIQRQQLIIHNFLVRHSQSPGKHFVSTGHKCLRAEADNAIQKSSLLFLAIIREHPWIQKYKHYIEIFAHLETDQDTCSRFKFIIYLMEICCWEFATHLLDFRPFFLQYVSMRTATFTG